MKSIIAAILLLSLASCGKHGGGKPVPPVNKTTDTNSEPVVLGTASIRVQIGEDNLARVMNFIISPAYAATQPVTVVLAPNTTMTMNATSFVVPALSNDILDFGTLNITALDTNDLRKCGADGKTKCTKALIRVYTSGVAGAGFYNSSDSYGVPLLASGVLPEGEVGLGATNAQMVQQITIASNVNRIRLTDFSPAPVIHIKGDFANAGAGSYSTTINVEFALAP